MPNPFLFDLPKEAQKSAAAPPSPPANPFLFDHGVGYGEDISRTIPAAAARTGNSLIGLPGDLLNAADQGWKYIATKALEKLGLFTPEQAEIIRNPLPNGENPKLMGLPRSGDLNKLTEKATGGPLYKPQTLPGELTDTTIQMSPAAVLGAGTPLQRLMQVVVPAATTEAAGQLARRTIPELEGPMRVGGALLGAGGVGLSQRYTTPTAEIKNAMQGATPADVRRAGELMREGESQGVFLPWDETIQKVTNGATRLSDLRRTVENSRGGGSVFKSLMADRPRQVGAAADAAIGNLAPGHALGRLPPINAGLAAQDAAKTTISDTQAAINSATRPYYAAGENNLINSTGLFNNPIYRSALVDVRRSPELNSGVANLRSETVGVTDLVQRRLREMAENARVPGQAQTSNLAAANLENTRTSAIAAAEQATGGPRGSYATARTGQSMLRGHFLEPLTEGPMGQIAATSDVMKQGRAILPNAPPVGFGPTASDTVTRLAMRNPEAAAAVVHARLRSVFDEATQNLASGPNQWGGANFAAQIAGNSEQAKVLQSVVRALPNGDTKWVGFRKFLDVMEATGKRPQPGSMTAFNAADQARMTGGVAKDVVTAPLSLGTSVVRRLNQFGDQLMMGHNTEQIARILVNPTSGRLLERLAAEPQGSPRAAMLALRLSYMGRAAARGSETGPNAQK